MLSVCGHNLSRKSTIGQPQAFIQIVSWLVDSFELWNRFKKLTEASLEVSNDSPEFGGVFTRSFTYTSTQNCPNTLCWPSSCNPPLYQHSPLLRCFTMLHPSYFLHCQVYVGELGYIFRVQVIFYSMLTASLQWKGCTYDSYQTALHKRKTVTTRLNLRLG